MVVKYRTQLKLINSNEERVEEIAEILRWEKTLTASAIAHAKELLN